jgi:nicotinamidase-related amidase
MTSLPIRDPLADHLITPQNAALIVIDYQQNQLRSVRSMDSNLLVENVVSTTKLANLFGLPIVHSTVGVAAGLPTDRPNVDQFVGRRRLSRRGSRDRKTQSDPMCPLDRDVHGV